jgi:hypothetical protein
VAKAAITTSRRRITSAFTIDSTNDGLEKFRLPGDDLQSLG